MSELKKSSDSRFRNWATVVYPESAPADWLSIVSDAKVPIFVSPLHDQDVNPTNEPKKPHYHVLIAYEGKKSREQVEEFTDTFGGVGLEKVQSLRGYARYLCHLDNPDKFQYDTEQVQSFGGADYASTIGLPTDKYKAIREMMEFCRANDITSYAELLDYASVEHFDWFRVLCDSGTVVIKEYLKSITWGRRCKQIPTGRFAVDEDGVIQEAQHIEGFQNIDDEEIEF